MSTKKRETYSPAAIAEANDFVRMLEAEALPSLTRPSFSLQRLLDQLFRAGKIAPDLHRQLEKGFTPEQMRGYIDELVSQLLACVSQSDRDFLRQFPVGLARTGSPNAFPILTTSGVPAILIDICLIGFISNSNRISLCTKDWGGDEIRDLVLLNVETFLSPDDPDDRTATRTFKPPRIPSTEVLDLFTEMVYTQELFVLAHEYAHLLLGHVNQPKTKRRELLSRGLKPVDEVQRSHAKEFEADEFASDWCRRVFQMLRPERSRDSSQLEVQLQCGELFLLYCRLTEAVAHTLSSSFTYSDSHPPAVERLQRLRRSTHIDLVDKFSHFYFTEILPELGDEKAPAGEFPFCDWYMEKAKTMSLSPQEIVAHFASCPKCGLTYDYLMAKNPR